MPDTEFHLSFPGLHVEGFHSDTWGQDSSCQASIFDLLDDIWFHAPLVIQMSTRRKGSHLVNAEVCAGTSTDSAFLII